MFLESIDTEDNLIIEDDEYKMRMCSGYFILDLNTVGYESRMTEKKFEEILNILNEKNILFVNDIKEEDFDDIPKETKNLDKAKQRFLDFKDGKFDWEIVTLINKGEKLSKIYSKSKKLMTIFSDLYFDFMDDVANFDFFSLKSYGFKTPEIEEFIQKRDKYYKERRI